LLASRIVDRLATGASVSMQAESKREHVILFVLVNGATTPADQVIAVGCEVPVELTTEVQFVKSKQVKPGRDDIAYRHGARSLNLRSRFTCLVQTRRRVGDVPRLLVFRCRS
jgi:hypothetical protein